MISGKSVAAVSAAAAPKKNAVYMMAGFVLAVMIAWLGFLSWAVYTAIYWLVALAAAALSST